MLRSRAGLSGPDCWVAVGIGKAQRDVKRDWKEKNICSTDCMSSSEERDEDDVKGFALGRWGLGENAVLPE